ncbi:energy transducer TonB [Myroides marinus]|uniref:energy transducer TonB n=1 Tax=Myroides marinus TaxID=703342 RepID=UPI000ACD6801|nr:energy transducer TonB [Myroides marinus]
MKTVLLRSFVALLFFTLGAQSTFAQKRSKNAKKEQVTTVQKKDTVAIYAGDFKEDFLRVFFKESGKIVYSGTEFKFVLSLILTDTGVVEDVIVLGVDNTNVKERMKTIAKNLGKWTPEVKAGQDIRSQVTVPFAIKESEFIMNPAELDRLLAESKERSKESVYSNVDTKATYPDGMSVFVQQFVELFTPPIFEGDKLRFAITFIVEKDGTVTDIKLYGISSPNQAELLKEITKAFVSMKKWIPAIKDGKPVRSQFTLPLTLQNASTE